MHDVPAPGVFLFSETASRKKKHSLISKSKDIPCKVISIWYINKFAVAKLKGESLSYLGNVQASSDFFEADGERESLQGQGEHTRT